MLRKNKMFLLAFIMLSLLMFSCTDYGELKLVSEDEMTVNPPAPKQQENKVEPKDVDESIAELTKKNSNYVYSSVGKRDPFKSYFSDFKILERDKKITSELQRYDLSSLRVSGILVGIAEPRAMIVAPNAKTYIVKKGEFLGKNWGKISRILPTKIEIIETYKDALGRKILNRQYLNLPIRNIMQPDVEKVTGESK